MSGTFLKHPEAQRLRGKVAIVTGGSSGTLFMLNHLIVRRLTHLPQASDEQYALHTLVKAAKP
jgi:hypothetical protein